MKNLNEDYDTELLDEDPREEIYDYVSSLFGTGDAFVLRNKINPLLRLKSLNTLEHKVCKTIEPEYKTCKNEDKLLFNNSMKKIKQEYLNKLLKDILHVMPSAANSPDKLKEHFTGYAQKQIGYFDSVLFFKSISTEKKEINIKDIKILFNEKEFNYNYNSSIHDNTSRRIAHIKELFSGNHKKYLKTLKDKLSFAAKSLFKNILFLKCQALETDELEELISYLIYSPEHAEYNYSNSLKDYEGANALLQNPNILSLLSNGQTVFYNNLKILKTKLQDINGLESLTNDDKYLISLLMHLKKSPEKTIETFNTLNKITEIKSSFAEEAPNILLLYLFKVEKEINNLMNKPKSKAVLENIPFESGSSKEFAKAINICNKALGKTIELCKEVLKEEEKIVKKLQRDIRTKKIKIIGKNLTVILITGLFLFFANYVYNYFFDIEGIYKNNFYKNAKLSMEAISYPPILKDSKKPVENEIRQRQRLDYIKDLNSRYFKTLSIFLDPNITDEMIKNSFPSISIPKELKIPGNVKSIRKNLGNIISPTEWKNTYALLFGPNILTQLRAYGAISNFLVPSLTYHVIKDSRGLPVKKDGLLQVYTPKQEKEILNGIEPKVYINKYDENYIKTKKGISLLLKRVQSKKLELIKNYRKSRLKLEKENLKITLRAIALIESRLTDLNKKIKTRHDYIVKHNTYRLPLDKS